MCVSIIEGGRERENCLCLSKTHDIEDEGDREVVATLLDCEVHVSY